MQKLSKLYQDEAEAALEGRIYIMHRQDLYAEKQALLPTDSTREIELTDTDLEAIYGGSSFSDVSGLSDPAVSFNPIASTNPAVSFNPTVSANPIGFENPTGLENPEVLASFSVASPSN